MSKEIYISSTPHETRLAIVENDDLTEIYYERENEYTLAGSIYNGKVTRVLPGMQSSFVDLGLERDAFLYITDFMEEAGDSADFDTSSGNRGRGSDSRRSDHPRETSPEDAAPTLSADPFSSDFASPAPDTRSPDTRSPDTRSPEPRSGDRGRRRRGGTREARPGSTEAQPRDTVSASEAFAIPEPADTGEFSSVNSTAVPSIDQELGEGAPGADGSRRWRGRRGRRRGRGGNRLPEGETAPDLSASELSPSELSAAEPAEFTPDPSAGYDLEDSATAVDLHASADATWNSNPLPSEPSTPAPEAITSASDEPGPRDRSQRERGGRNRDARGGREGRERPDRRDDRSPRVPRGFTPSRALYGVDEVGEQPPYGSEPGAPPEPVILPGEVLSKYQRGGVAAQTSQTAAASLPPAAEFALPGAWDGGSVLPGETLRPRAAAADTPRGEGRRDAGRRDTPDPREDRGRGRRGEGRSGQRSASVPDQRPFRSSPQPQSDTTAAASLAPSAQVPFRNALAPVEQDDDGLAVHTPPAAGQQLADAAPQAPASLGEASAPLSPEIVASAPQARPAETEYEPTEAAASHRFDPLPPREFRQPAPEIPDISPETSSREQAPTLAHSITPPPGTPLHSSAAALPDASSTAALTPVHELTSLTPDGELLSDTPPPPPAEEVVEPTSPLRHETAVLHAETETSLVEEPAITNLHASEHTEEVATVSLQAAAQSGIGEPESDDPEDKDPEDKSPRIEEPTVREPETEEPDIDDPTDREPGVEEPGIHEPRDEEADAEEEDFHTTTLHAASIEEIDYDDESEVLDGAADLGSMIRDMSIDQLTQPADVHEPEEDEEDDFAFEEEDTTDVAGFSESAKHGLENNEDREDREEDEDLSGQGERQAPLAASSAVFSEAPATDDARNDRARRGGRRDGRRNGRGPDRGNDRNSDRGNDHNPDRSRTPAGSSGDRRESFGGDRGSGSRSGRRDNRHSAQTTNLPAISDLLKPGQEVLVQIAKEPIAKKGARITSHIALPGRFLVFMPTVNHTGVSRKIESDGERRRLKEILLSEKGEASGGFIVRTAAAGATEEELRSDLRFLLNLWADIKQRSEASKSPALIYHDLNLVERILRDQVTDNFSAIWVDTEAEYERVLRFLQRFQPSLIRRVKLYTKETPLFEQFGVTEEINKALRSKVWLKSGGSIVINQTEALVAIDINTGKYVGKTARLEDTIVKTNLDAIPEIVRQIRLRDLGGIIIIDFIDMDERKNRNRVMAVLEEELKKDRAPSKVLQFNDFGLVAITRKRVKQSLERTLSTTCGICAGTGMVKSAVTVCNDIYIEMRKMQKHLDRGDVMLRVNPEVVKQLKSPTAKWLQEMEEMVGKTILIKSDPSLHPEQFDIH